jgi:RNA polymerase sigma factor (sigma-70 family)
VADRSDAAPERAEPGRGVPERVARLCRLLVDRPRDASDVEAEVLRRWDQARRAGEVPEDEAVWIVRTTVRLCAGRRPSRMFARWRRADEAPSEAEPGDDESAGVWQALRALTPLQRQVYVLHHIEGLGTTAVSDILGIAPGSVKRHGFQAVSRLRRPLGGPS